MTFEILDGLFGSDLKPIGLTKLFSSDSSTCGCHDESADGRKVRNGRWCRKLTSTDRMNCYCLYLKSLGPIFSSISAHFSFDTFETFSTVVSLPSSLCWSTLEASRTALA